MVQEMEKIVIKYLEEYHEDRRQDHAKGIDDSQQWIWEVFVALLCV